MIKSVEDAAGSRLTARETPHRFLGVVLVQNASYKRGFRDYFDLLSNILFHLGFIGENNGCSPRGTGVEAERA